MHSPLHASSPNNPGVPSPGVIVIAAISGRALASAARLAGYRVRVADFFGDIDTRMLAERVTQLPGNLNDGIDPDGVLATLRDLTDDGAPTAVVLGSGFERRTDLIDEIAGRFPLAGNTGAAVRRVKDPVLLARDCAALGIPHPEICWDAPADPENWVIKTAGGAGGAHVGRADRQAAAPGRYFQRFVPGNSVSALFIADRDGARVVGFSRQWTAPAPQASYRYGGAARFRRFPSREAGTIGGWLSDLSLRVGLVGLCSADFIRGADGYHLIEINPRPGATLDLFDHPETPLLQAHLRACRGEYYALPRFADAMASTIAYTDAPVASFPAFDWPDWTADRQSPGTPLGTGDPVCTVFARGAAAAATRKRVVAQALELQRQWTGERA